MPEFKPPVPIISLIANPIKQTQVDVFVLDENGSIESPNVADTLEQMATNPAVADMYLTMRWSIGAVKVLQKARLEAGLTTAQVAEGLKKPESTIKRWECDLRCKISLADYSRYLAFCGCTPRPIQYVVQSVAIQEELRRLRGESSSSNKSEDVFDVPI